MRVSLPEIQAQVDKWVRENGGYWSPLAMLAAIMEELGEISREISHQSNVKPKKKTDTAESSLEMELGDLLFSIICMANYHHISLAEAIKKSI
jgi:NTP pyrophosphatase (non-canonical NTP hydrolase)